MVRHRFTNIKYIIICLITSYFYFSYFNFLEDSSDSGSEDEEVSSFTHQRSTCHLSSLTQINTIDAYGVIPLSILELDQDDQRGSAGAGALKGFGRFVRKYFFCISTQEHFEGQEDEVTSESIDDGSISHGTSQFGRPSIQSSSRAQQQRNIRRHRFNSVSKVHLIDFLSIFICVLNFKIDKFSRVAFPLLFFAINILYWIFYLTRSQRR